MIEQIITCIIKELGATGLLIVGLYFILKGAAEKIYGPLKTINEELGEIRDILKSTLLKDRPQ